MNQLPSNELGWSGSAWPIPFAKRVHIWHFSKPCTLYSVLSNKTEHEVRWVRKSHLSWENEGQRSLRPHTLQGSGRQEYWCGLWLLLACDFPQEHPPLGLWHLGLVSVSFLWQQWLAQGLDVWPQAHWSHSFSGLIHGSRARAGGLCPRVA